MNKRYTKVFAAVTGLAMGAAVIAPFATEHDVLAKWLPWGQDKTVMAATVQNRAEANAEAAIPPAPKQDISEVVLQDADNNPVQVQVAETKPAKTVEIDAAESKILQQEVNTGKKVWMLNPVEVVRNNAAKYGFDKDKDRFTLMSQNHDLGSSRVLVQHVERYYLVTLTQPIGKGSGRIWQVQSIREVRVIEKSKPDVGTGVIGLDYEKVIAWQQNVDEGRELWRLDPLSVAREEGKRFGFTTSDKYTIVKHYSSTKLARHGEIHVQVEHKNQTYTMILVRPLGSDDGAIWTIYSVSGRTPVETPVQDGKVLFSSDQFKDWKWQRTQYLKDMAFTTVVDYEAQRKQETRIPESILANVKNIDYGRKVVVFAYLGEAPGGGHDIGIEKVSIKGNNMTVQVRAKSPRPGQPVTMMLTHPYDFVTIDRSIVDIWGGVNISFVDENGKVLSQNKLTISHR